MATKGVELASAYISLGISVENVPEQVEKALKGADKQAHRAGQKTGKQFTSGMGSEMSSGGQRAGRGMSAAVAGAAGAGMGGAGRDAARKFNTGFQSEAEARGTRVGTAIGTVIGKSIGGAISLGIGGAATLAAGAIAGLGYTLNKGFQRLKSLDQAQFKLRALGKTTTEVEDIVKTVTDTVTGTPFSLDAAFSTAVQAIGAGTDDIKEFMTTVADAAGFAGTDIERMGLIFNQVLAKGKLTGEEMAQLMEAGLPAKSWIMQSFKLTSDQFDEMQKNGEITLQMLEDSVDKHAGGMAKKLGESLQGALDNVQASIGRLGASLITAMSGGDPKNLTAGINTIKDALDSMDSWVKTHVPEIIRGVEDIGSAFLDAGTGALELYKHLLKGQELYIRGIAYLSFGDARERAFADADAMKAEIASIDEVIAGNKERKKSWQEQQEEAARSAEVARDLGDAIKKAQADTNGGVILRAPTAADLNQIDEAKYRIEQIPGTKDFKLIPRTEEATTALNTWREKEASKPLHIGTKLGQNVAQEEVGAWRTDEEGNPVRIPVDPETDSANAEMQAFIDQWTKGITIPVSVGPPGSHAPGQNPLDVFAPGGGRPPGQNPLDVFAPGGGRPQGIRGGSGGMGAGSVPMSGGVGGRVGGGSLPSPAAMAGIAKAQAMNGLPYSNAVLPNGVGRTDCSGYLSQVYNAMTGKNVSFTTMSDFEALGFRRGYMPGALNIGNTRKPGQAGHMAGTLPNGVNIESGGGSGGVSYNSGPGALGEQFSEQWYFMPGYSTGGAARGPGTGKSDSIPAYLSNGEHVLTAAEVAMMGGQSGVYAFRNALHRNTGGEVDWLKGERKRTPGWVPRGNFNPNMKIDTSMASSSGAQWYYKMLTQGLGVEPWKTEQVGSSWHMGRLLDLISGGAAGYRGDVSKKHPVWPPMRFAQGGAISLDILKRLQESGGLPAGPIPPEAMQGLQAGAQAFNAKQQGFGSEITQAGRTEGYIPAGAGFTGKTGGGLAGGLLQMGAEAVKGAIDMAASAGAGMFPGAGVALGMGANAAKRGVDWAAEMGGIGIGAITEILTPFGAPRWLTDVDPTSFMPQMGVQPAAVTSGEQAMQNEVAQQQGLRPPAPPGVQAGADAFRAKAGQPLAGQVGTPLAPAPHTAGPPPGPGLAPKPADDPFNFLKMFGLFDQGGILQPNSAGLNLSNRPEYVLTPQQWKTMESNAQNGAGGSGTTYNIYPRDVDEAVRELRRKERLAMMQHSGRP